MQLAEREPAEISKHIIDAEAVLAVLPQKPSQITAELGLGVVRGALFALDESAPRTRAARTYRSFAWLSRLSTCHRKFTSTCASFKVLGTRQKRRCAKWKISCRVDARYRQQSLRAELQGVRAELAGEDPAAALEPARRAQMLVDELGERLGPIPLPVPDAATPGLRQGAGAKSPQQAVAELVQILGD